MPTEESVETPDIDKKNKDKGRRDNEREKSTIIYVSPWASCC